jgi:hypothetical protein
MASTTSSVLPLSKPDFPLLSSQRNKKIIASSTTFGRTRLQEHPILRGFSKLHRISTNGFVVLSRSNDQVEEIGLSSQETVGSSDPKMEVRFCLVS